LGTDAALLTDPVATRTRRPRSTRGLSRAIASGIPGRALAAIYLSLLVLLPIAAVLSKAFTGGPRQLWDEITFSTSLHSLELSVSCSLVVVVVNAFAGTAIAWMLVRDRFRLNRITALFVDLPFALPTVIAGIILVTLYGSGNSLGIDVVYTRYAIVMAMCFVTLPFAVRSVQPVLASLDDEAEEAAASLGASAFTTFRRVTLPSLAPAILTGAGLGFARALGEYGSVALVSGDIPNKTLVASVNIFGLVDSDDLPAAAAVSLALFVLALVVLGVFSVLKRRIMPAEAS
jgi:sulfate/thiosulfate transport system permease protein